MKKNTKMFQRSLTAFLTAALVTTSFGGQGIVFAKAKKKASPSVSLTVTNPAISMLSLKKGETFQLKVKVTPKKKAKKVTFRSTKSSIVSVNKKGKCKAKKAGKAKVIVSCGKKKTVISVTVTKKLKKVKKVTLSKKSASLFCGSSLKLTAKLTPAKTTKKGVVYRSSKSSVASVSKKGVVMAKKKGTAVITAYAKDGRGAKAVCKITVKEKSAVTKAPAVHTSKPQPTKDPLITEQKAGYFTIAAKDSAASLYLDAKGEDYDGLSLIAASVAKDISLVTKEKAKANVITKTESLKEYAIIAGSIGNNAIIDSLIEQGKVDASQIKGKREVYRIQVVENPVANVKKAIVVIGSDKRGTIYGLYHISEKMGVSPWVYWGDATPVAKDVVQIPEKELTVTSKEPSVKYRGIFLNDEAPSLTSYAKKKFGGYNQYFYENVYELILRCKGNYLWPAMWSNTFSEDGKGTNKLANAELADKYGIVMGTSHHEPLCRAGVEWQNKYRQYGTSNAWDFNTNETAITKFWEDGVTRNKNFENVYTLGMRGESDSSLSGTKEENIALLKKVITAQKDILKKNNLSDAPQVLTVYKEVEDYWHGTDKAEGLKKWDVLNDVTIMLCDDNFGNMRTLPTKEDKNRKGGYGMYYHFDYHGGPTSYEWVNTVPLTKTWEQMNMAYEHGIDNIWIVNVGDLKPMEMNISYFLDMAYDYDTWGTNGKDKITEYRKNWVKQQFGENTSDSLVNEMEMLLDDYTWLNGSGKPESINSATYDSVNYNEGREMLVKVDDMIRRAKACQKEIPSDWQAAYFELVYFPVVASANVTKMQILSGINKYLAKNNSVAANLYAAELEQAVALDKELQKTYNKNMPGVGDKWDGMMSSPHVGFVTWNSTGWSYPKAVWVKPAADGKMMVTMENEEQAVEASESGTLSDFTNLNQESYTVTVSNQGANSFAYTITPSEDWIVVSKKSGTVKSQDAFEVSVDFSKVKKDASGSVKIQSGSQTITLNVNAKVYDTSSYADKTYVYTNGYASILPGNYVTAKEGGNNTAFHVFDGYGKTGQSMKILPTNADKTKTMEEAAYAEYAVCVPEDGEYKFTVYTAPSNNLDRDKVCISYGYSINGETLIEKNTVDADTFLAGEYSGSWANDVKVNGRKQENNIHLNAGVNAIRIYSDDPAFLLQKLVVSEKSVKSSNAGPKESYYVGKKQTKETTLAGVLADENVLPGTITTEKTTYQAGETFSAKGIVSESESYFAGLDAKSDNAAKVKISCGDRTFGTVTIGKEQALYEAADMAKLDAGSQTFTMTVVSGNVSVSGVTVRTRDYAKVPGSISASDYEGVKAAHTNLQAKKDMTYSYLAQVEKDDLFVFYLKGKSVGKAFVTLKWNDQTIGEVQLSDTMQEYMLDGAMDLTPGLGNITMEVTGADAVIESLSSKVYEDEESLPVSITATSEETSNAAENVYDKDEKTTWKPQSTDANPMLTFEFKDSYQYDRFMIQTKDSSLGSYEVQVKQSDDTWKTIYTGKSSDDGKTIFVQGKEAIESTQVRFVFADTNVEVSEITLTPYVNWAMKDAVKLAGQKKSGGGSFTVPNSVVDGDRITKGLETGVGGSSDTDRHEVTMTFSEPKSINVVRLFTLQESESASAGTGVIPDLTMTSEKAQYSYRISYYENGKWTEMGATVRPDAGINPKVTTEVSLKRKVKASKIKVEIYTSHWIRINELEAVETHQFSAVK